MKNWILNNGVFYTIVGAMEAFFIVLVSAILVITFQAQVWMFWVLFIAVCIVKGMNDANRIYAAESHGYNRGLLKGME